MTHQRLEGRARRTLERMLSALIICCGLCGVGAPVSDAGAPTGSTDPTFRLIGRSGTKLLQDRATFYASSANNYYLWHKSETEIDEILADAKRLGLQTIRLFVFCEAKDWSGYCFQRQRGVYDQATFRKLDYVIARAGELGVRLILPLVNQWDDGYGGMRQYVNWLWDVAPSPIPGPLQLAWLKTTDVNELVPGSEPYRTYQAYHDLFYTSTLTRDWYKAYVQYVLTRTNSYTQVRYQDDPTILMWELANEPRAESDPSGATLQAWIEEMAAFIKRQDSHHLVSTGEEGWYRDPGRVANPQADWQYDGRLGVDYVANHRVKDIDACSFHLFSDSYGVDPQAWIEQHVADCHHQVGKPAYLAEFGGHKVERGTLLYGFASDVIPGDARGWRPSWDNCYAPTDPTWSRQSDVAPAPWIVAPADGSERVPAHEGVITFHTTSGFSQSRDCGGAVTGPFDLRGFDRLVGFVYVPAPHDSTLTLSADVYVQYGPGWTWLNSAPFPVAFGQWNAVSFWLHDIPLEHRRQVQSIGIRLKMNTGVSYVGPVHYDHIVAVADPTPLDQFRDRDEAYRAWGQTIGQTDADGAGVWFLNGFWEDGVTPHDNFKRDAVYCPGDGRDDRTCEALKESADQLAAKSRKPVVTPWRDCESGAGLQPATWSDAERVEIDGTRVDQGRGACKLVHRQPNAGRAYWEFGPLNEDWSDATRLTLRAYAETQGTSLSVVVATGQGWGEWHETRPIPLTPGWNDVIVDLRSSEWKTAASGWNHTQPLAHPSQVNRVLIGYVGYATNGSLRVDNLRLGSTLKDGLAVYYSFDAPAVGGQVQDESGSGHHASVIGAPKIVAGRSGRAMSFSGSDSLRVAANPTAGWSALSVSLWFKTPDPTQNYKLASAASWQPGGDGSGWIVGTHYPEVWSDEASNAIRLGDWERMVQFVPGAWNHLALTYDGERVREYINGELAKDGQATGAPLGVGRPLEVGAWSQYAGYNYKGLIDEFRVYDRALSFAEIQELSRQGQADDLNAGLLLHYPFDTDEGLVVHDTSGLGHHATVRGARYVPDGIGGGAYYFHGQGAVIVADSSLGFVEVGSIAFWMKPGAVENWRNPFSTDYASGDDCIRFEASSTGRFTMGALGLGTISPYPNGVYEETYTETLQPNQWAHVVYAWDRERDYGYLNGRLVFSTPHPSPDARVHPNIPYTAKFWRDRSLTFNRIAVGNGYSTALNRYWKGLVDDVRIYNRVLSAGEVATLVRRQP